MSLRGSRVATTKQSPDTKAYLRGLPRRAEALLAMTYLTQRT